MKKPKLASMIILLVAFLIGAGGGFSLGFFPVKKKFDLCVEAYVDLYLDCSELYKACRRLVEEGA